MLLFWRHCKFLKQSPRALSTCLLASIQVLQGGKNGDKERSQYRFCNSFRKEIVRAHSQSDLHQLSQKAYGISHFWVFVCMLTTCTLCMWFLWHACKFFCYMHAVHVIFWPNYQHCVYVCVTVWARAPVWVWEREHVILFTNAPARVGLHVLTSKGMSSVVRVELFVLFICMGE